MNFSVNSFEEVQQPLENSKKREYPYAELSKFDDLCSSLLLDSLFLGFETHKFIKNDTTLEKFVSDIIEISLRELSQNSQDLIPALLVFFIRNYVLKKELENSASKILEILKGNYGQDFDQESLVQELRGKYSLQISSKKEEELYKEHLCRYLMIYVPNAGFEINRTWRCFLNFKK